MADLTTYKELCDYLNGDEDIKDNLSSIVYDDYDFPDGKEKYEYNGKEYDLSRGWDSVRHRFDADIPEYFYWQFDPSDEYAIYAEGYYDSWAGGSVESSSFSVGKVYDIVKTYKGFKAV